MTLQVVAANAGTRVLHTTPKDRDERIMQRFITRTIYSEMSLLSSIICSMGTGSLLRVRGGIRFTVIS